jgi:hypothetical protein
MKLSGNAAHKSRFVNYNRKATGLIKGLISDFGIFPGILSPMPSLPLAVYLRSPMLKHLPLVFGSPRLLGLALLMVGLMVAIASIRRIAMRGAARICILMGAISLAIAAGQPIWNRPARGSVTVMVDLSPSTRGATFRDRAALLLRVHQLLGDVPYQLIGFANRNQPLPDQSALADISCDQTVFSPPSADAILLFSDGRFELPAYAPPTYPVIDPAMDRATDAAVTDLQSIGQEVLATFRNNGTPRQLIWTNASRSLRYAEEPDSSASDPALRNTSETGLVEAATPTGNGEVTASVPPGDLWPENDSLSLAPPYPDKLEQWWIGRNAPAGWRQFDPANLPADASDYLRPAVIVLNNIPSDALSSSQQLHLVQYVRDLGSSVVIVGGDHAFAAGDYDGTLLDELSPLASSAPKPSMQWLLLIDASGSMAGDGAIPSPWQTEVNAITRLLPQLPANDSLSIGSFAESLGWWSTGNSVADTRRLPLPPPNIGPHGPTNLAAALSQIASSADGGVPGQLLLMTDADTDLPDANAIAQLLNTKNIHLHLLAIGHGRALPALRQIASATSGSVIEQLDAGQWVNSATLLLRSALPDRYQHRQIEITPPPQTVTDWNQTWMKSSATELEKSAEFPMAAKWHLGLGTVTAIAYPASIEHVQSFAAQIAAAPNDPRFTVTWNAGRRLKVEVTAIDRDQYLNGESIQMEKLDARAGDAKPTITPIPQTAPGQYQVTMPAPRSSQLITIRDGFNVLKRFATAGRYPPEFDAIGNDRENLHDLAERTGGSVINPGPVGPIQFNWPTRQTNLISEFAFAGFAIISGGLLLNRRSQ